MIPTRRHLEYALGYLDLGLPAEARREIAAIPAAERGAAPVLAVDLEVAMAAEKWTQVVRAASRLAALESRSERPWIAWAYALRERGRVAKARDVLLRGSAAIASPTVLVDYNLACYFCLLGELDEARRRLGLVLSREPSWEADAGRDPDLAALRGPGSGRERG